MLRRPRFLLPALAIAIVGATAGPAAAAEACPDAGTQPDAGNLPAIQSATLCLLNQERAQAGQLPLAPDALLTTAATRFSERMVAERFFAHEAPDGTDLVDRLKAVGYLSGSYSVGENIAWGSGSYATPASIVRSWMNSPGHRTNILSGRYQAIGVGVAIGAPRDTYSPAATYTTDFGNAVRDGAPAPAPAPTPTPKPGADAPSAGSPKRERSRRKKRQCRVRGRRARTRSRARARTRACARARSKARARARARR